MSSQNLKYKSNILKAKSNKDLSIVRTLGELDQDHPVGEGGGQEGGDEVGCHLKSDRAPGNFITNDFHLSLSECLKRDKNYSCHGNALQGPNYKKHSLALRDTPMARLRSTVKNPQAEIRAFCFILLIKTFDKLHLIAVLFGKAFPCLFLMFIF